VSPPSNIHDLEREAAERRARVRERADRLERDVTARAEAVADTAREARAFPHAHAWWLVAGATAAGFWAGRRSTPSDRTGGGWGRWLAGTVARAAAARVVSHALEPAPPSSPPGPPTPNPPDDTS
jgi:hypothetical protein